jgi:hypothetical protein
MPTPSSTSHSAAVRLRLDVENGSRSLFLTHVGPDSVRLRDDADLPPQDALVIASVDWREQAWPVTLPDGVRAGDRFVRIVSKGAT